MESIVGETQDASNAAGPNNLLKGQRKDGIRIRRTLRLAHRRGTRMTTRNNGDAPTGTTRHDNVSEALGAVADALQASMRQGHMPFLEVSSNSMAPLLKEGDRVGLAPVPPHQLRRGDIVTFLENGHFTTHRFWSYDGDYLHSRGDRSPIFDRPWRQDTLLGRVVVCEREGRPLWLDRGAGRNLNRLLFVLGRWEHRLVAWRLPIRPVRAGIRALSNLAASLNNWRQEAA